MNVSAMTKEGIDDLLEMILLEAEMLELQANPDKRAKGSVVEAHLSKGRGPVATLLVMEGTLKVGQIIVAQQFSGKVRALIDDQGQSVKVAGPGKPVEILGLDGIPTAGDSFFVVDSEKKAKEFCQQQLNEVKAGKLKQGQKVMTLEDLYAQINQEEVKEVKIVLKADNTGSLEALKDSFLELNSEKVEITIIHQGIGGITENDVILAKASQALIIGFHVRPDQKALDSAEREGIEIKTYQVIYEAIDEIKSAMEGVLDAKAKEVALGQLRFVLFLNHPNSEPLRVVLFRVVR